jgi:hypothetical protein
MGFVLIILRQRRVDIHYSQKNILEERGDDEFKDYCGGLSMSRKPQRDFTIFAVNIGTLFIR